jgi:hypothetical protein
VRGSAVTVYETRRKLWDLLPSESLEIECSDAESDDASESLFCAGAKKMSTRVPLYGDFCVWRFYIYYLLCDLSSIISIGPATPSSPAAAYEEEDFSASFSPLRVQVIKHNFHSVV